MRFAESHSAGVALSPAFCVDPPIEIVTETTASPPADRDCQALTDGMSRGDEAAFQEFHQRYFSRLLRYLFVVAGGQEEVAREALQSAFVRVALHVRPFDAASAFWNWLAML